MFITGKDHHSHDRPHASSPASSHAFVCSTDSVLRRWENSPRVSSLGSGGTLRTPLRPPRRRPADGEVCTKSQSSREVANTGTSEEDLGIAHWVNPRAFLASPRRRSAGGEVCMKSKNSRGVAGTGTYVLRVWLQGTPSKTPSPSSIGPTTQWPIHCMGRSPLRPQTGWKWIRKEVTANVRTYYWRELTEDAPQWKTFLTNSGVESDRQTFNATYFRTKSIFHIQKKKK